MRLPGKEMQIEENIRWFSKLTLREKLNAHYKYKKWVKKMRGLALNAQKHRDKRSNKRV
jgi:hypothetical protein